MAARIQCWLTRRIVQWHDRYCRPWLVCVVDTIVGICGVVLLALVWLGR